MVGNAQNPVSTNTPNSVSKNNKNKIDKIESSIKTAKKNLNKLSKNMSKFFEKYTSYTKFEELKSGKKKEYENNKIILYIFLFFFYLFTPILVLLVFFIFVLSKLLIYIGIFLVNIVGMFSGASIEFFKQPDPLGDILKRIYIFFSYLLCIPFTAETKKFGTLNKMNNISNNRNKNLEKKCGGWWIVWGSILCGYLLISLTIGPGALIGLIILIPSLHSFTLTLNKTIENFKQYNNKKLNNNNNNNSISINSTKVKKKELLKATPFKKLINKFLLLILFNLIITLILASTV